jgi:hypothetical protein
MCMRLSSSRMGLCSVTRLVCVRVRVRRQGGQLQRSLRSHRRAMYTRTLMSRRMGVVRRACSRSMARVAIAPIHAAHMMMPMGMGIGKNIQMSKRRKVKPAVPMWLCPSVCVGVLMHIPRVPSDRRQSVALVLFSISLHILRTMRGAIVPLPRSDAGLTVAGGSARALRPSCTLPLRFLSLIRIKWSFLRRTLLMSRSRSSARLSKSV